MDRWRVVCDIVSRHLGLARNYVFSLMPKRVCFRIFIPVAIVENKAGKAVPDIPSNLWDNIGHFIGDLLMLLITAPRSIRSEVN